jgi:hypothetical protein
MGASGSDCQERVSGGVGPSGCDALSAEGEFWHSAPQAAKRRKEMTRIGAVPFTVPSFCGAACGCHLGHWRWNWRYTVEMFEVNCLDPI